MSAGTAPTTQITAAAIIPFSRGIFATTEMPIPRRIVIQMVMRSIRPTTPRRPAEVVAGSMKRPTPSESW